ncbi:MAG TPA: hypothetical protein VI299_12065, partial [Polyangiales bacterium]
MPTIHGFDTPATQAPLQEHLRSCAQRLERRISMRKQFAASCALALVTLASTSARADDRHDEAENIQVGPRPYYLLDKMAPSPLKKRLEQCKDGPFYKTNFSIGHRGGGTLQFHEHTKESHEAGARMGA